MLPRHDSAAQRNPSFRANCGDLTLKAPGGTRVIAGNLGIHTQDPTTEREEKKRSSVRRNSAELFARGTQKHGTVNRGCVSKTPGRAGGPSLGREKSWAAGLPCLTSRSFFFFLGPILKIASSNFHIVMGSSSPLCSVVPRMRFSRLVNAVLQAAGPFHFSPARHVAFSSGEENEKT